LATLGSAALLDFAVTFASLNFGRAFDRSTENVVRVSATRSPAWSDNLSRRVTARFGQGPRFLGLPMTLRYPSRHCQIEIQFCQSGAGHLTAASGDLAKIANAVIRSELMLETPI
jgi:hypothetical protein